MTAGRSPEDIPVGIGKRKRGPLLFTGIYVTLLLACSVAILLSQFVIPREITPVRPKVESLPEHSTASQIAVPQSIEQQTASPQNSGQLASEPEVILSTIRIFDTNVHIADICVPDASYLCTAMANNTFGVNIKQTVAEMAQEHDALIAINGDYFGFRREGYVIRGGELYRNEIYNKDQEDLCLWPDGNMTVIREAEMPAQELMDQGVQDVLSFGPALVLNGEIQVSESLTIGPYSDDNPRTAIGMVEPLHYLFVVSDGRTDQDKGLTPYQLAELMRDMGAQLAYNLDGGGSSTMVYEGEIINYPTARGYWEERRVSDIVYIRR